MRDDNGNEPWSTEQRTCCEVRTNMAFAGGNVASDHCKEEQYPLQHDKLLKEANCDYVEERAPPQSSDEEELITDFKTGK